MPLQGKKPFIRLKPPFDLKPNEELFYCKITHEVFREYEQFFDRVILCNSLIWSCALTGKPGLTFQEAVESEKNARIALKKFPELLKRPLLYLATLTSRGRINDLYEDVYAFVKPRFFVGEEVEVTLNGVKKSATVTKVVSLENEAESQANQDGRGVKKPKNTNPDKIKYEVKEKAVGKTAVVKGQCINRAKGSYTRANNKLFLKHHVTSEDGIFKVKHDAMEKHKLQAFEFKDAFTGSLPKYACSPTKRKSLPPKKKSLDSSVGRKSNQSKINFKKDTEEETKLAMEKSQVEFEKQRLILIEQKQKQKDEYKKLLEAKKQEAKAQKMKEKEKKKEEQKKVAEYLSNWKQPRDDLECDDLKDLPKPVPIKCSVPQSCFGDAVSVLEFINTFGNLLKMRDFFHHGFTFQHLEKALFDMNVNGLFNDLLQLLLGAFLRSNKVANGQRMSHLHGSTLGTIPLDSFSLTEVLRSSFLKYGNSQNFASPSELPDDENEDPDFDLKKEDFELIKKLATTNVFNFNCEERLKILMLLIHEINTCETLYEIFDKEFIDSSMRLKSRLRQIRLSYKGPKSEEAADISKDGESEAVDLKDEPDDKDSEKMDVAEDEKSKDTSNSEEDSKTLGELLKTKAESERRKHSLRMELERLQASFQNGPIGRDRGYRRYWLFPSLPGLYVEDDDSSVGPCLPKPTLQLPPNAAAICRADGSAGSIKKYLEEAKNGNSDKENDILHDLAIIQNDFSIPLKSRKLSDLNTRVDTKKSAVDGMHEECLQCKEKKDAADSVCSHSKPMPTYGLCTACIETCPIHNLNVPRTKWSFFPDRQDYHTLVLALNTRGYRESSLRKYLVNRKEKVLRSLSKCPVSVLNSEVPLSDQRKSQRKISSRKSQFGDLMPDAAMEMSLRDMVIRLERRLFDGGLGSLDVPDRKVWSDSLEFRTPDETEQLDEIKESEKQAAVVKELIGAITEVAQSIECKYIGTPLVSSKSLQEESSFHRWKVSIQKCTSLSQIYIHFGTLDRSIKWSKSALNAKCKTCRKQSDHDKMLLCDECNLGYHMYCLKPPLKKIPYGDWFCSTCKIPKEAKPKPNYKECDEDTSDIASSNESEDESDDEKDESDDDEEDVEDEEEGEANEEEAFVEEVCETCRKPGTVICCDDCPKVYHPECIGLKRIPRGDWSCPECQKKEQKKNKTRGKNNSDASSTPDERRSAKRKAQEKPKIQIQAGKRKKEESSDSDGDFSPKSKRIAGKRKKVSNGDISSKSKRSDSAVNMTRRRSKSSGATDMLDYKTCLDLLVELMHHPSGWPFLVPVSKKDAPDYHHVIKRPMDFGTIKSNLNNMIYKTNDDFLRDVYLVLENCELFNSRSSLEFKAGQLINKELKKLLKSHALSHTFTAL